MGLGGDLGWVLWPTLGNHVMVFIVGDLPRVGWDKSVEKGYRLVFHLSGT